LTTAVLGTNHYSFPITKCGSIECGNCKPPRIRNIALDPIPGEDGHYKTLQLAQRQMKAISYHFRLKEQYTSFRCRCTACEKYQFDITVCDEHNLWRLTSQIKNKGTKLLSEMPELAIVSLLITNIFYLVERMFLHVL